MDHLGAFDARAASLIRPVSLDTYKGPISLLQHEENLRLLHRHSSDFVADALEYVKRDLVNSALSNTDNHGRNTSLIKTEGSITLSPIYDVTCMKFFKGDFIVELTRWQGDHQNLKQRLNWLQKEFRISREIIDQSIKELLDTLQNLESLMYEFKVPTVVIERNKPDRQRILNELRKVYQ